MAAPFPYAHYACPCSATQTPTTSKRASQPSPQESQEDTFNPHDPRAAYSLYPLENLLFCDECAQIRCPKCVNDEVINWYCPSCLFEVPSSGVRSEGNRCARNCYNCPSCTAPLGIAQVEKEMESNGNGLLKPGEAGGNEAYLLFCQYCDWTSLDIGVRFSRPTKITEQLAKARKARFGTGEAMAGEKEADVQVRHREHDDAFEKLAGFYKEQLSESGDAQAQYGGSAYGSPANLARIMSMYGGLSHAALKKSREKPQPMREAAGGGEGFATITAQDNEDEEVLQKMQNLGWEGSTSEDQKLSAPWNNDARFHDEVWPVATQLRTKKGRRCKYCRQFIVRPEPKVGSTRYKIRIIAHSHIPRLSLRPLHPQGAPQHASFMLRSTDIYNEPRLQPYAAQQYVLTLRNPIFEKVKVTLATPATTPGRVASKVTILCPSFSIGPAGDVWDDALSTTSTPTADAGGRKAAMASLTGNAETDRQPEAGKPWEVTRNSTSVILEIVPGQTRDQLSIVPDQSKEKVEPKEDDHVLEVPVYVHVEWTADAHGVKGDDRVPRELNYWCVLGVGRIAA